MSTPTAIAGRYRVDRRLGAGGMATVFLATDQVLERPVAIKLLADHLAEDEDFVARFRREALAAARLQHPNIVQVFDSGEDPESRRHFIVMEFVDGPSCADLLRDRKQLDIEQAVRIVCDSCHGLDYAHRAGVVHRDVKPGNLLLGDESGTTKLADFGIAKAAEQTRITQVGSVLGTAAYLSPEQARGDEAGPASDVYSLGVCAYQFLTGRLPHEYSSLTELALKQQQDEVESILALRPEVSPELDRAIRVALEREPGSRYASALEMAGAIEAGLHGMETEATRRLATAGAAPLDDEATRALGQVTSATRAMRDRRTGSHAPVRPPTQPPAPPPRAAAPARERKRGGARRRFGILLALLAVLIAVGAVAFAVLSQGGGGGGGGGGGFDAIQRDDVQQQIDDVRQFLRDNTR
jgi:serine/threonine-protein kinase